ncbi:MAG: hypothetical protein H8D88_01655 [Bacteroidetes bacterium]|nr:hypothetical protein [Bacteroidota bacterium]
MKKKNRSRLEEEMRYHIQAWKESKQSKKAYCLENNLPYHKFLYWMNKFRRRQNPIEQSFIPVHMDQQGASLSLELEIAYPNGVRLRVPSDDIQFIGRLIRLI